MSQQHQGLHLAPLRTEPADQQIPGHLLPAALAPAPGGCNPLFHQAHATVYRRPVFGGGFEVDYFFDHPDHLRLAPGHRPHQVRCHQYFSFGSKPNAFVLRLMARSVCCIFATRQLFLTCVVYGFATVAQLGILIRGNIPFGKDHRIGD
jgi:hypothetical protein